MLLGQAARYHALSSIYASVASLRNTLRPVEPLAPPRDARAIRIDRPAVVVPHDTNADGEYIGMEVDMGEFSVMGANSADFLSSEEAAEAPWIDSPDPVVQAQQLLGLKIMEPEEVLEYMVTDPASLDFEPPPHWRPKVGRRVSVQSVKRRAERRERYETGDAEASRLDQIYNLHAELEPRAAREESATDRRAALVGALLGPQFDWRSSFANMVPKEQVSFLVELASHRSRELGFTPIQLSPNDRVRLEASDSTRDLLFTLATEPTATLSSHPALSMSMAANRPAYGRQGYYLRLCSTTVSDELDALQEILTDHPAMLERVRRISGAISSGMPEGDHRFDALYVGTHIGLSPEERAEQDRIRTASKYGVSNLLLHRLKCPGSIFTAYAIPALERELDIQSSTLHGDRLTAAQLFLANEPVGGGEIERLLIALSLAAYNSHPGGSSDDIVDYDSGAGQLGPVTARVRRLATLPVPLPPLPFPFIASSTAALASDGLRSIVAENLQAATRALSSVGEPVVSSPQAMNVTVDNAVGQGSALGLILGLDITVSDATFKSTYWGDIAGNGPRLFRSLLQRVAPEQPLPRFVNLYSATTSCSATAYSISCLFMARYLVIDPPRVLLIQGGEAWHAVTSGHWILPDGAQEDAFLQDPDKHQYIGHQFSRCVSKATPFYTSQVVSTFQVVQIGRSYAVAVAALDPEDIVRRAGRLVVDLGLGRAIKELRDELDYYHTAESLSKLGPKSGEDIEKHMVGCIAGAAKRMSHQLIAVGAPYSVERALQIRYFLARPGLKHTPESKLMPLGSPGWLEWANSLPTGMNFQRSVGARRSAPIPSAM